MRRDVMDRLGLNCLGSMEMSHPNGKENIGEINRSLRKFRSICMQIMFFWKTLQLRNPFDEKKHAVIQFFFRTRIQEWQCWANP